MKLAAGALAGAVLAWLVAPHTFAEFTSVRHKVVRTPVAAGGEHLRVPIPAEPALEGLRPPFAAISRVRNDGVSPLMIRIAMDDREVCAAEIAPGRSQRLDCVIRDAWSGRDNHHVRFSSASPAYTVEYFELATHHGAVSPGPRNVIVVPAGSSAFQPASMWHMLAIGALLALSVASVRHPRMPRVVSATHLAVTGVVAVVMAAVILSSVVSAFSLLISQALLERLLLLTALPVLVVRAYTLLAWTRRKRPAALPFAAAISAGLVVCALFWSFAAQQVAQQYNGNVSGLILISHRFFDKSPIAASEDIEKSLVFSEGGGYDGQFFYYMTFDPFLTAFRHEPRRYSEYIDLPPYRYGRIGFSLLTKIFSGDDPARYPITMIALVLGALATCGALLGTIARQHGLSPWYGLLILVIPGFWRSTQSALPEPLAIACVLAAYLGLLRRHWWVCGALLGLSMLVRETGGGLVLALTVGIAVAGHGRASAIVAVLAFAPVVLWKAFVGWVFWPEYGPAGLMPAPNDVGLPFAGVTHLWATIARGEYFNGWWAMVRAGLAFPILTTAGAALGIAAAIKRPSAVAAAALFYAVLTIAFNYEGVWLHVANAQRLTIDLFVALALVTLQPWRGQRVWPKSLALFWCATAVYLLFGTFEAVDIRSAAVRLVTGL